MGDAFLASMIQVTLLGVVGDDQVEVDAGACGQPALGEDRAGGRVRSQRWATFAIRTRSQAMPAATLRAALVGVSVAVWRCSVCRANCSSWGWMAALDAGGKFRAQVVQGLAEQRGDRGRRERSARGAWRQWLQREAVAQPGARGALAGGVQVLANRDGRAVQARGRVGVKDGLRLVGEEGQRAGLFWGGGSREAEVSALGDQLGLGGAEDDLHVAVAGVGQGLGEPDGDVAQVGGGEREAAVGVFGGLGYLLPQ